MASTPPVNWARVIREAIAAGITGGIIIEIYLYLTTVLPAHGSLLIMWQGIASAAIGNVAHSSISYAWLGLVIHFIVSIGWAGGYAYFSQTQAFVDRRWAISGLVYGIIVYFFMQLLLIGARAWVEPPTPLDALNALIAHMVFFGIPVAFVVARMNAAGAETR
jgi:uncharacterized membrane protein YagU involved in acid resistance